MTRLERDQGSEGVMGGIEGYGNRRKYVQVVQDARRAFCDQTLILIFVSIPLVVMA